MVAASVAAELHCWNGAGGGWGGGAVSGRVVERVAVDAGLNLRSSGESITWESDPSGGTRWGEVRLVW